MSGHIPGDGIIVVDTRRRWSEEERQRALDDTKSASVSSVARKHGVAKSLLFRWRKEAGLTAKRRSIAPFVPVRIAAAPTIICHHLNRWQHLNLVPLKLNLSTAPGCG